MHDDWYVLLACTVGGTWQPIVESMRHWRPERVLFVPSVDTNPTVNQAIIEYNKDARRPLSPSMHRTIPVSDAQDLSGCVEKVRELDREVTEWLNRGASYHVVADFTAGTKCLSAALVLHARRWRCWFSYVGGTSRNKDGIGVVETGSEQLFHHANPWDALGFQVIEECAAVFNRGGYSAAAGLLEDALHNLADPANRRTLATLKSLVEAYALWDCFNHAGATRSFKDARKNRNDLGAIFPFVDLQAMNTRLDCHLNQVSQLANAQGPEKVLVEDLWQNAQRRAREGRYDDAVARVYRTFEALAQVQLCDNHGFPDTEHVAVDRLPVSLRDEWASSIRDGSVRIGLQEAYRLLQELGDGLGARFVALGLADKRSPLAARNRSILAHGFRPVTKLEFESLNEKLLQLGALHAVEFDDWRLPTASAMWR